MTNLQSSTYPQQYKNLHWITPIALFIGFLLTVVSWLELCSKECAANHEWLIFGFPFEAFGFIYFGALGISYLFSKTRRIFSFITLLLLAAGIGAEAWFIIIQKYQIGHWCPVCLSIASILLIAAFGMVLEFINETQNFIKEHKREEVMKNIWKGISSISMMCIGFMTAFVGVTKYDQLAAAESSVKSSLAFGNKSSPIEIYVFTDWACPACRALEPQIEALAPKLMAEGQVVFVDFAVHPETLNFTPYNLAFMIKNKPAYLQLRNMLSQISETNQTPTEEQIAAAAQKIGEKYDELHYADVALATKYFNELAQQFQVNGTPTVVVINTDTKKGRKLVGANEITESNLLRAISSLKQHPQPAATTIDTTNPTL